MDSYDLFLSIILTWGPTNIYLINYGGPTLIGTSTYLFLKKYLPLSWLLWGTVIITSFYLIAWTKSMVDYWVEEVPISFVNTALPMLRSSGPAVLRLYHLWESPRGLVKTDRPAPPPTPPGADSVGLGWGPWICTADNFLDGAASVGLETKLSSSAVDPWGPSYPSWATCYLPWQRRLK